MDNADNAEMFAITCLSALLLAASIRAICSKACPKTTALPLACCSVALSALGIAIVSDRSRAPEKLYGDDISGGSLLSSAAAINNSPNLEGDTVDCLSETEAIAVRRPPYPAMD
jgi:hypothetical protein